MKDFLKQIKVGDKVLILKYDRAMNAIVTEIKQGWFGPKYYGEWEEFYDGKNSGRIKIIAKL